MIEMGTHRGYPQQNSQVIVSALGSCRGHQHGAIKQEVDLMLADLGLLVQPHPNGGFRRPKWRPDLAWQSSCRGLKVQELGLDSDVYAIR